MRSNSLRWFQGERLQPLYSRGMAFLLAKIVTLVPRGSEYHLCRPLRPHIRTISLDGKETLQHMTANCHPVDQGPCVVAGTETRGHWLRVKVLKVDIVRLPWRHMEGACEQMGRRNDIVQLSE